ncbi:integrase, putative [Pseudomonas chlororaphis subsp. piscium]|uniref:tyrosine-type recombinase/integrase n=1 Tax=Pseudomonas chlororaphis TaxID=587753 RepID=UPI000F570BAF|nr:integrase arm-type DNA-binding domain-containing protein [Pseudomonas chlororaphis]AZC76273.1 integrase, putative [Pseudomonas chlororaphis subsp. piscium]
MKALSDARVRTLTEPGKHTDGVVPGLYLEVGKPRKNGKSGSKLWRLKYRLHGKENRYAVGAYPVIGLAEAREIAWEAKRSVASGIAPRQAKIALTQAQRATQECTFRVIAEKYVLHRSDLVEKTQKGNRGKLDNHIYPVIGDLPVTEIKAGDVSTVIERLGDKRVMAKSVLGLIKAILGYAQVRGDTDQNVAAGRHKLLKPIQTKHHSAILDPAELGRYLRKLDSASNGISVLSALRLLVILPVRPNEMASMRWEQIDLSTAQWFFTVKKGKKPREHVVPLPKQALDILHTLELRRVVDKAGRGWVFPSPLDAAKSIDSSSLLAALLNGLGFERGTITAHGFRASFRSLARKHLGIDRVVLELMLSHLLPGPLGDAYDRDDYLDERRTAAQQWADYLDSLRERALADAA